MNTKMFWLAIVAVIISFAAGFYLANSLNRNELMQLRAENENLKKNVTDKPGNEPDTTLTDDEIRTKIAEADKNPSNIEFQRNLGLALFSYAAMKQNVALIGDAARLLQRANESNPKDRDVLVTLGHCYYDTASIKKDSESFKKARDYYLKALEIKPDDAGVQADYGSTFLYAEPADPPKAAAELQKALQIDPKNERGLQFMTLALIKQDKKDEARKSLDKLKEVSPQNPVIAELEGQLVTSASPQKK